MAGFTPIPRGPREDVAYLSRSEHRADVLAALSTRTLPRHEVGEVTGTTRTTLGRILAEFEGRGWIERTADGDYATTPRGKLVARELTRLFDALAAVRELGDLVSMLPLDDLTIGLQHFSDATVVRADSPAPDVGGAAIAERVRGASTVDVLTYIAPPHAAGRALEEVAGDDDVALNFVCTADLVDYLRRDAEGPPDWAALTRGGARIYRYEGRLPCNLVITDGSVLISGPLPDGAAVGSMIESRNDSVLDWATGVFETYRGDAEEVAAEAFAG